MIKSIKFTTISAILLLIKILNILQLIYNKENFKWSLNYIYLILKLKFTKVFKY